jgi:hypothetical protein
VITLTHSFATLTDAHGQFHFDQFPADEPISISAWHPLFQEASAQVTVGSAEKKELELVVKPVPQAVEAAPVSPSSPSAPSSSAPPDKPAAPAQRK